MNQEYMNAILNLTTQAMTSDDPNIVVAATEFWNTISEEEKEINDYNEFNKNSGLPKKQSNSHVKTNLTALLKSLTDILLKYENEDISDSGKSIHDAAFKCLMAINDVTKEVGFDMLVQFVNAYVLDADETKKIASMIVFSSMIEIMPAERMNDFVIQGFQKFVEYLGDSSLRIRITVSDLLSR